MSFSFGNPRRGSIANALADGNRQVERRRARRRRSGRNLGLEALEHRELLSVTQPIPAALPDDPIAVEAAESPANAAPVAVDDAFSMMGNQQLGAGILNNDSDPDGDPLSAVLATDVSNGTLALDAGGLFTYTPNEGFTGTDSFTYLANDGQADSNLATVTISVGQVKHAPQARSDGYVVERNGQLVVAADAGVLANDTDVDGDPLTAILAAEPEHGTLVLAADGSFEYTPDADFRGDDSFTYQASDGERVSAVTTVNIKVGPLNEAPVGSDDAFSVNEDELLVVSAAGVLGNDVDADGDPLTAALRSAPRHGVLTLGLDGSFEYLPASNFYGSDSFTYVANDGKVEGNLSTVSITVEPVNDLPVSADEAYSVGEDQTLVVGAAGVLGNDSDIEGDPLTAVMVDAPTNGSVALAADGSFEYIPAADFNGQDSFTYVANDGTADGNLATVTITVEAANDLPVSLDDAYAIGEDETLIVEAAGVLGNDSDVDGDPLTAALVDAPTNGSVTLAADGSFEYIPAADFNGEDSFTYVANDGTADGNLAVVTIAVEAVNDLPVSVDDAYAIAEDETLIVEAAGVLANDADVDGDPLSAILVDSPVNGTLSLAADGSFEYVPAADFNGQDSFTYLANDGTADGNLTTVTIAVEAVNDLPVSADDAYAIAEDETLVVEAAGVLGNDSDVDGDPLTAALVDAPTNGSVTLAADGSFEYIPAADFNGEDSFTYVANDGTADGNLAVVTIAVEAVNDLPVSVDDAYAIAEDETLIVEAAGVLGNDTDVDGDPLTAILVDAPTGGTVSLAADGSFEYVPGADFNGEDSFTYLANDGTADGNLATVTIAVDAVNDLPVSADDAYAIAEDETLIVEAAGVLGNDSDADGDPLTAVLVDAPTGGTVSLAADGSFEYIPAADFNGEDSFTYLANDGTADGNLATVTIAVEAVNDLPVSADDAYAIGEDETLIVEAAGVLGNDSDADGDPLTAVLVDAPTGGTVTLSADGSFEYIPAADFNGEDSFTYLANDGTADGNLATVTIAVEAVNDLPVSADDAYAIGEDETLIVEAAGVLGNDSDADGDALAAVLVDAPANGTVTLSADGSFEYIPAADFNGEDSFTYLANDGTADGNLATVTIAVEAVNDLPLAADDAYAIGEDETLIVEAAGVLGNDSDADGDALAAVLVDAPANGTVTLSADGSFEYIPAADFNGEDSFTYLANDGTADGNPATVTIAVEAVNDVPVSADDAYAIAEDETLIVEAAGLLGNDSDADGDPLTAVLVDAPANGTVTLSADGAFEYTPAADFHGEDSFTYLANDGTADGNLATVTIAIEAGNDLPVSADDAYVIAEDQMLAVDAAGVLANDADPDGDALTAVLLNAPANGTVTLADDGSFEYMPAADFHGEDSFTYVANDGTADGNPATVNVTVEHVELAIKLDVSGAAFGAATDATWAGTTFWVNAYVQDLRDLPEGVVGGAFDVSFDPLLVTPTGEVAYGESFAEFQQGTPQIDQGLIDETGALATESGVGVGEFAPFAAWQFVAVGDDSGSMAGRHVAFAAAGGDGTDTVTPGNFALVGSGDPVDWTYVELGSVEHDLYSVDYNGDAVINHFDLALWLAHSGSAAGDPGYEPLYDLNADMQIDAADADMLMGEMYQPLAQLAAASPAAPAEEGPSYEGGAEGELLADSASAVEDAIGHPDELAAVDELFGDDTLLPI